MKNIRMSVEGKTISLDSQKHFANLVKVNQSLNLGAQENYRKNGLIYVDVPEIVGITGACENVDTLFKIGNRVGIPLFFSQTGQLSLEQSLQSFPGVYTVIHSGRDEEKEDKRHLRQFRLTEEEFDCTLEAMTRENYDEEKMFDALMQHIQVTVQAMIRTILANNKHTLEKEYRRNINLLEHAASTDFLKIDYANAVKLLRKNGFNSLHFGDDLKAGHEAKIVALMNHGETELPVFIMRYPKEIKFFNMKVSKKDHRVVLSMDLIFPYSGESTGAAVREHDYGKLQERLLGSRMFKLHTERGGTIQDFAWYLKIMKEKKTNPHAGYGIGNERVMQYIFGSSDIRKTSLFALFDK